MTNSRQPVDAGVTGCAQGNQPFNAVLTRAAVMHMDPPRIAVLGSAALATTAIPKKNFFAMTAKTALRIPETHLAEPTEVGTSYLGGATWAEETSLGSHEQIVHDNVHYR